MDDWNLLTKVEKNIVTRLLTSDSKDKHWLQAAVLTSRKVPSELLRLIIPNQTTDELCAEDVFKFEPTLLKASVQMYIGEPQPLWWIGTHHREMYIWPRAIELIALAPTHFLFSVAFKELLFKRDVVQINSIITNAGTEYSEVLFELMLQDKIKTSGDFMPEIWVTLFLIAPDSSIRSTWIERMASHSLSILNYLGEARSWIPSDYLNEFYSYFSKDLFVLKTIREIEQIKNDEVEYLSNEIKDEIKPMIELLFEKSPPSHYATCDTVKIKLQKIGFSTQDINFIQKRREVLIEELSASKISQESEEISDWIF